MKEMQIPKQWLKRKKRSRITTLNTRKLMNLHDAINSKVRELKIPNSDYDKMLNQMGEAESVQNEIDVAEQILEKLKYHQHYGTHDGTHPESDKKPERK
jgi:hypothetical protein